MKSQDHILLMSWMEQGSIGKLVGTASELSDYGSGHEGNLGT